MKVYELIKILANVTVYAPEAEIYISHDDPGVVDDEVKPKNTRKEKLVRAFDARYDNNRILVLTSNREK